MENRKSFNRKLPSSPNLKKDNNSQKTVVRIRFSRKGPSAYVAHLDMMRIFERSMKRAGIECEYSQGFNPRPSMAFALPLGVGVETIDDYVDVSLQGEISPIHIAKQLNTVLPEGISVLGAIIAPETKESMMAQVGAAQYLFVCSGISEPVRKLFMQPQIIVTKMKKDECKKIDIKPLILAIEDHDENAIKVTVKAGSKDNLRPDLFLDALAENLFCSIEKSKNARIIRIGTFLRDNEGKFVRPI